MTGNAGQPHADPDEKLLALRAEYEREATRLDRAFVRATAVLARPSASIVVALIALLWTGGNAVAPRYGWRAIDPPPYEELQPSARLPRSSSQR